MLKKKKKLNGLDLQNTSKIASEPIEAFPDVKELNLSNCVWVDDNYLIKILEKCPSLKSLKVVEDLNVTYRGWGAFSLTPQLAFFDASECHQISNEEIDLIAVSAPQLTEIHLSHCRQIGDEGILSIAKHCNKLVFLDLSHIQALTEKGIVDMATYGKKLEYLNLSNCKGVTDQVVMELPSLLTSLKELEIEGCSISESVLEKVLESYPKLNIVAD